MSSKHKGNVSSVNAEINVTPMADIMLVLLIIFMITTPMLQKGITVNLPRGHNVIEMPAADKRDALVVGMDRTMRIYLGAKSYDQVTMKDKLAEAKEIKMDNQIFFKCDTGVIYEKVVETLDLMRETGFEQIGLLVDQQK